MTTPKEMNTYIDVRTQGEMKSAILNGSMPVCVGDGHFKASGEMRLIATDSVRVTAHGSCMITAKGSSRIIAHDDCRITASEEAKVTAYDNCYIQIHAEQSEESAPDLSRIEGWALGYGNCRILAEGYSSAWGCGNAGIIATGHARVFVHAGASVIGYENTMLEGDGSSAITAYENASACATGKCRIAAFGTGKIEYSKWQLDNNLSVKVRFAHSEDSDGNQVLTYVSGSERDAADIGYMKGSSLCDLSPKQYAKMRRLVDQAKDGSEIPFEIRAAGSGVRIYEF